MAPIARSAARVLAGAALILTAALAGCSTPAPPPPPPPAPAPPPPPPPIGLSTRALQAAAAYEAYMNGAAQISADFHDGGEVADGVRRASAYEPQQFQQGAIAYAAVAAMQEPTFVAAVREFAKDPSQRKQIAATLVSNPGYATTFAGSDRAAGLAINALDALGAKVVVAGRAVKQSAYDVQHQAWSKANVDDRDGRLARAKASSATPVLSTQADVERLRAVSLGQASLGVAPEAIGAPYTQLVARGLAVAALAVLGEGGDDNADTVAAIMAEPSTGSCLNMAKLNLYQCLAVSKPHYEDIFCLGQHEMMDTGQCIVKAAGSPHTALPALPPPPPPPAKPVKKPAVKKRK